MKRDIIGSRIGKYEIIRLLGSGGMGIVYEAREVNLNRPVAFKVLRRNLAMDSAFLQRFYREAQVVARISHPNVVHVYDLGEADGHHFIAMEYVRGSELIRLIRERGRLPLRMALDIARQTAAGLHAAHLLHIIHRDIKPENIMVQEDGRVKIMDFGIAKMRAETLGLTMSGHTLGTPAYMSPEQCRGKDLDGRTDVYSLGVVLYKCLTGEFPFSAETPLGFFEKILCESPTPVQTHRPELPPGVWSVVERAMSRELAGRFASAEAMERAILELTQSGELDAFVEEPAPKIVPARSAPPRKPRFDPGETRDWAGASDEDLELILGDGPVEEKAAPLPAAGPPREGTGPIQRARPGSSNVPATQLHHIIEEEDEPAGGEWGSTPGGDPTGTVFRPRSKAEWEEPNLEAPTMETPSAEMLTLSTPSSEHPTMNTPLGLRNISSDQHTWQGNTPPPRPAGPPSDERRRPIPEVKPAPGVGAGAKEGHFQAGPARPAAGPNPPAPRSVTAFGIRAFGGPRREPVRLGPGAPPSKPEAAPAGAPSPAGRRPPQPQPQPFDPDKSPAPAPWTAASPLLRGPRIVVCPDGSTRHRSIAKALADAPPGAEILVKPGTYQEAIQIHRPVRISAEGAPGSVVVQTAGATCLTIQASEVHLSGLTLKHVERPGGARKSAVAITHGRAELVDCEITSEGLSCVEIAGPGAEPTLLRCHLWGSKAGSGVMVHSGARGTLDACLIENNHEANVLIGERSDLTLRACHIRNGRAAGVRLTSESTAKLIDCGIEGNNGAGIFVTDGANPLARGCHIINGQAEGVSIYKGGNGTFEDCRISGNAREGVLVERAEAPNFRRCEITDNGAVGFHAEGGSAGTLVECVLRGNKQRQMLIARHCKVIEQGNLVE